MPFTYKCKNCDEVLYEGELIRSPEDVMKSYLGKCPRCMHDLAFSADNVSVEPRTKPYVSKQAAKPPVKEAGKRGKRKP